MSDLGIHEKSTAKVRPLTLVAIEKTRVLDNALTAAAYIGANIRHQ